MEGQGEAARLAREARELARQGRLEEAVAAGQAALEAAPTCGEAGFALGVALARAERFAEAAEAFEVAVRAGPHNAAARRNLALAYERTGRWAEAREEWAHAARLLPAAERGAAEEGVRRCAEHLPSVEPPSLEAAWEPMLAGAASPPPRTVGAPAAPPPPSAAQPPEVTQHRVEKHYYQEGDTGGWSVENLVGVLTQPHCIIQQQRGYVGIGRPIHFLFWNVVLALALSTVVGILRPSEALLVGFGLIGVVCSAVVLMAFLVPVLFLRAGLYHALVSALGGGAGYTVTFRALALASATWVVGMVLSSLIGVILPGLELVGDVLLLASTLWGAGVTAIALQELHDMPLGKAIAATAIAWVIETAVTIGLIVAVAGAMAGAVMASGAG